MFKCMKDGEPDFENVGIATQSVKGKRIEIWVVPCKCCKGRGTHADGDGPMRLNLDCVCCAGIGEWTLTNRDYPNEILEAHFT